MKAEIELINLDRLAVGCGMIRGRWHRKRRLSPFMDWWTGWPLPFKVGGGPVGRIAGATLRLLGKGQKEEPALRKKNRNAYILVYRPDIARTGNYILEHRAVWIDANGCIPEGGVIHHINKVKTDNRLENLEFYASNMEHGAKCHPDLPAAFFVD